MVVVVVVVVLMLLKLSRMVAIVANALAQHVHATQ